MKNILIIFYFKWEFSICKKDPEEKILYSNLIIQNHH